MASSYLRLKNKVIALRKKGRTYGEIKKIHDIPKSTISYWLKNIQIPFVRKAEMKKRTHERWIKLNKIASEKRSLISLLARENIQEIAEKEIKKITTNDLKLIGTALYWAEGNKKYPWSIRFSNSDPQIIRIMMRFLKEICCIPKETIRARVHFYPMMDYEKTLRFWCKITDLPIKNFYHPQLQVSKASKRKRDTNTLPHGTLHLIAGNTKLASTVKGWIRGIIEKM